MNTILTYVLAAVILIPCLAQAADDAGVEISDLSVEGRIEGENIVFTMDFKADVKTSDISIPLVEGDVACLDAGLPRNAKLSREGNRLMVTIPSRGVRPVALTFASRPVKDGDWRRTGFLIPMSSVRRLAVVCDRDDLEIEFPGALDVKKHKNEQGKTVVTAFLGSAGRFEVRWKPEVRKLDAELVVACEASSIEVASVGALRLDNVFTYRVAQGALREITLDVPENANVTEVDGMDIQDWKIEKSAQGGRTLTVTLSRPWESAYRLQVKCETVLPEFPCEIDLPVLIPKGVIRTSGFLILGTDSAIKLLVSKMAGLTQVDQASFPVVRLDDSSGKARPVPARSAFAYQYANMPYTLVLKADDIVPEYSADERLIVSVEDNDMGLDASIELDFRDAPAREIVLETDPEWVVASVAGKAVSDYDVRDADGKRAVHVYFSSGMLGRVLIDVRLERSLGGSETEFAVPSFKILDAKAERGYLVLTAEKGLRLKADKTEGLREVHSGSIPVRASQAQQAFRFRETGWSARINVERTKPTIHSEIFNLASIGDGVLYGSASITYHISGAPVRVFKLKIPEDVQDVEFAGRDIRGWNRENGEWTVSLQEKVIGDYTLLVTYDRQIDYDRAELAMGGIETVETESEVGFIALASDASLNFSETEVDPSIIRIDREEIPQSYMLLVNDPVIAAYKYVRLPHKAKIRISRYGTERLLDHILDHASLSTSMTEDGESVTKVTYFIKNASCQYLSISLPEGARLWLARHMDENGKMVPVAPLKGEHATLIPVGRPRDPNMPLQVEIVYAQSVGEIGPLGSKLKLEAPVSPETQATFARWTVNAPGDMEARGMGGGNMMPDADAASNGLARVVMGVLRSWQAVLGWIVFAGAAVLGTGLVLSSAARRRGIVRNVLVAVVLLAAGLVFGALVSAGANTGPGALLDIFALNGRSEACFTRTLNLAGSGPLTVEVDFAPVWFGAGVSPAWVLLLGVAGIVLSARGLVSQRKSAAAVGLTLLAVCGSSIAIGRPIMTAGIALGVPAGLAGWTLRAFWRNGLKRRQSREAGILDEPLFVPDSGWAHEEHAQVIETCGEPPADEENVGGKDAAGNETRPPDKEPEIGQTGGQDGFSTSFGTLLMITTVMFGMLVLAQAEQAKTEERSKAPVTVKTDERFDGPVMDAVKLTVDGPGVSKDEEKSAKVKAEFVFSTPGPMTFVLLESSAVVTDVDLGSRHLRFASRPEGYVLSVLRGGDYKVALTYLVPITEQAGVWSMKLGIPTNLKNKVVLRLPGKELDVHSNETVYLTSRETGEEGTEVMAVFGPVRNIGFTWQSRVRKAKLEKVVFFCEVNTFALFKPGVVELTNLVRFQVAQGEVKAVTLSVHEGMSATSVTGPGLSTWRFDPETRQLEAVLEKPVSGDFTLTVITQVPREGLPYDAAIGTLVVKDAGRQRGSIAMAVPETVQIGVENLVGLSAMNITDFSAEAMTAAESGSGAKAAASIKRAFRFQQVPVSASVRAEKVFSELKVVETGSLSVSDERIVLSTQLGITVSKAGVFSVRLDMPKDFDVESLSGEDVSHWDEVKDDGHGVVVHFQKQILGTRTLNVVIARMEKGIEETITVPCVGVRDARKHTGTLVISGERGVRMTTLKREGVSEVNPRDLGIRESGLLAFRMLRPGWQVILKTEVLSPTVKPEVLQRIDLAEGMLYGTVFIRYSIENAGCKVFRVQAPQPGTSLTITGRNVAKVYEQDKDKGIWQIELNNKIEQDMLLRVSYQIAFDPAQREVRILPLKTLDTEAQKGYLAVMSAKRVQITPKGELTGLKPEDSRSIPPGFGAGDMSDAILCYRTVLPDYELPLAVMRHGSADVLPAEVKQVRMTSVVSADGQMLTRVLMDIDVGDLRFLKMVLPGPNDRLWSVFVNGKVARPSRDNDGYRIPLEESLSGETSTLDIVYAGKADSIRSWLTQAYRAPEFSLPVNDVDWVLYVQPGLFYYGFDGTFKLLEQDTTLGGMDQRNYAMNNLRQIETDLEKARVVMARGEEYARKGKQKEARQALEAAMNYSQSQADFNEDARIQYRNLVKQQAFVGLVQRRSEMSSQNIRDEDQVRKTEGFRKGDFTPEYASQIGQSLAAEENSSLQTLAEKIIDQQDAAAAVAQAIRITLPEYGTRLVFHRPLQINPNAEMSVMFKAFGAGPMRWLKSLWPALVLLLVLRVLLAIAMKPAHANVPRPPSGA